MNDSFYNMKSFIKFFEKNEFIVFNFIRRVDL